MTTVIHPRFAAASDDRLDGWKAIAAYMKRDRTTVIRWARERGLPVHRLPGGRTATVFALRGELDAWIMPAEVVAPPPPTVAPPAPPQTNTRTGRGTWLAALVLVGVAVGIPAPFMARDAASAGPAAAGRTTLALPDDPATTNQFLAARDLIAEREAAGLERAIGLLQKVVAVAPDYALGHASLAEALLLSREFGMRRDSAAFPAARAAARAAIRLDPDLAIGHRLLGFIAYWADHDFAEAEGKFRRALALDPEDASAHFWYGNILSDHGGHAAALRALNYARLKQPGSVAIRTDLAWAQWAAGQEAAATAALTAIVHSYPDFAVAHDCLAIIALAHGDYRGYAHHLTRFAALKQEAALIANARAVNDALRHGIDEAKREVLRQAMIDSARDVTRGHALPAMIASVNEDRAGLLAILQLAERRDERWGDAGLVRRIVRDWPQDHQIRALIAARQSG